MRAALMLVLVLALVVSGCSAPPPASGEATHVRHVALRLHPGEDLRQALMQAVEAHRLSAAAVVTCVGSLTEATVRYANQEQPTRLEGHFEIVSLVGTLEPGGGHLHVSLSDGSGTTFGGHLLEGSKVYTTAEIVLVALDDLDFVRKPDAVTTYDELVVQPHATD